MNSEKFMALRAKLNEMAEDVLDIKGQAYAQDAVSHDRLANFKASAQAYGVSPLTIVGIFLDKHMRSIQTWIRESEQRVCPSNYSGGEAIGQRLVDARNYIDLLWAVYKEMESADA